MQTITKYLALIVLTLAVQLITAQENTNEEKIEALQAQKEQVVNQEKEWLRTEVEAIDEQLFNDEISQEQANILKEELATKHALNIENRLAIIDNRISLLERNEHVPYDTGANLEGFTIILGKDKDSDEFDTGSLYIGPQKRKEPKKYDRRTTSDLVFAIGFNNAIIEGQSLNDSPYKIGGSGFVELGWAWKTRLLNNSNAIRLKYGISFQWNKLDIKDNKYFQEVDDVVALEEFPLNLDKSKFRSTNLVIPVHFEFGPSKKIEKENYFRYSTYKKFKIGVGGYGGFVLQSMQKLKYDDANGDFQKDKIKDYNTNNFVYGLSSYISWGHVGIYAKYDLSTIFKDQAIDQNNISLGIRFDMD
ncbi:porin family protein [Formosa maritima]|uniref:PorT family protein n=1 Tax=Formosa maritima TaxID=2592046 RepID=A0A5D0GG47_9FLAO|nr:PorT family protein [Formosa maritima]TYA57985.1 PorT family protein [Formosa maritima]